MPTLQWIGKDKVVSHHLHVPVRELKHQYGFSDGVETDKNLHSGNKIIHGDNLEALKALLPEYEGKIKCIYIDPPYNTGNENWVYNDNVNDPKIKKWLDTVVGKEGEDLSRHDKWLCMMYPRLQLLHKLLADDGAIFISIDDNEQANLRVVCDEIFGASNFINNIIWQKKYSPQNDARFFSDMHDFIVCYAKNKNPKNKLGWTRRLLPRNEEQNKRYKNPDNDPRGPWKSSDLSVKTYSKDYDYPIITPSGRVVSPPQGRCWRTSKSSFEKLVLDNRIWFGENEGNVPSIKRFLSEVQDGTVPVTIWLRDDVGDNQEARQELKKIFFDYEFPFDTPKPVRLIERIVNISCGPNDIILDSFAGSGTTAHAVLNLNALDNGNRKFILIEMESYAQSITAERVKRIIKGYGNKDSIAGSFDFFELGNTLFTKEGYINEAANIDFIKNYIYYSETRSSINASNQKADDPFLGLHNDTAYYFLYEKGKVTTLNHSFLSTIKTKAENYIIYADNCVLTKSFMQLYRITFKKIPRDIIQF